MTERPGVRAASVPGGGADTGAMPAAGAEPAPAAMVVRSAAAGRGMVEVVPAAETAPVAGQPEPHVRVDAHKLESALLALRHLVVDAALPLAAPGVAGGSAERRKLLSQIDDYLLPRLRQSASPVLVALVGSTGAGKSTLVNSLVGKQVSATGVRRPTTNSPVLACHPGDVGWFAENVFLPTLPRVRQHGLAMPGRDGLLVLAESEGMPGGVALLDTPDIDSVVRAHREFAHQFLDASDLWLFMTSASRYADAAVWELLRDAKDRDASLAIVLSRVPQASQRQLTAHFDAMLAANGLKGVPRFVIPETTLTEGRLPAEVSGPVRQWLAEVAARDERRIAILTQTMSGVLDTFRARVPALAAQADAQLTLRVQLREPVEKAYAVGLDEVGEATRNGSLLSGEVLARWRDFAGAGDLLRMLQTRRARRRAGRTRRRQIPARALALKAAVRAGLETLVVSVADRAAEDAVAGWRLHPAGDALLREQADDGAGLGRASDELVTRAARAVSGWQDHVMQVIRAENMTKRSVSRVGSFDEESLALVLTIGMLGYGTAAAEVSDDGAGAAPQSLLTALFGAGPLRDLGSRVRLDLQHRIRLLLDEEVLRFAAVIDTAGVPDSAAGARLREAGHAVEAAR